MENAPFEPLTLLYGRARGRRLVDVQGAWQFLVGNWPAAFADTSLHRRARIKGLGALSGEGSVKVFRAALVLAAEEAGIVAAK
ncbi:MAG TPA: DUF982 domain-containing protein [Xanthobacteraceae bacterium]|nr:DUF982 domain-containing protein [Xanthobacteraceae bacterium]